MGNLFLLQKNLLDMTNILYSKMKTTSNFYITGSCIFVQMTIMRHRAYFKIEMSCNAVHSIVYEQLMLFQNS